MKHDSKLEKPSPLRDPTDFLKIGAFISAILAVISTIVGLADKWQFIRDFIFPNNDYFNPKTTIFAVLLSSFVTFWIVYRLLFKEREKLRDNIDRTKNLERLLDDSERERLLDRRTGVPRACT